MRVINFKYIFPALLFLVLSCASIKKGTSPWHLETYKNERFSYSLVLPKEFNKQFSQNGDGVKLTSPTYKGVEISAWGSHNALSYTLEREIAEIRKGKKLISLQDTHSQSTKGKILILEGKNQKIMRLVSLHNDIFYGVECSAPKKEFSLYQKLFEDIIQSFKIVGGTNSKL